MIEVETTRRFDDWLASLRDRGAVAIVVARIFRIRRGLLGDVKYIGSGVSELRINHGPGYRVYLTYRSKTVILLLCGGDKAKQASDIEFAKEAAARIAGRH
ncbi:type II toxin-antitoxin system RelE/ParE family toxin [Arenimonas daejeonensis]|uniref:type II toxin-antitoxin system RelE/ParE family toxin n=1 Tax=Arenimonas daejeonensis TaxID=370777 RepID=UPI0011BF9DA8|nr:type II toxin-antitoxin system RelE/ParE family toxin [Arenimonas daejeonensis]